MDFITQTWPSVLAVIIVPIVSFIKERWLNDIPIVAYVIQIVLAVALAFGLRAVFDPASDAKVLFQFILANSVVATATHAAVKTVNGDRQFRGGGTTGGNNV